MENTTTPLLQKPFGYAPVGKKKARHLQPSAVVVRSELHEPSIVLDPPVKPPPPGDEEPSPVEKASHELTVAQGGKAVRARFRFRCFGILSLMLLFTAGLVYALTWAEVGFEAIRRHIWIPILNLVLVSIVGIVMWFNWFQTARPGHQVIGLIFNTLLLTFTVYVVQVYLVTMTILRGMILVGIFVGIFAVYSGQSKIGFGKYQAAVVTFIFVAILFYFFVIDPYYDVFWRHPFDNWKNKPDDMVENIFMLLFALLVTVTLIWSTDQHLHKLKEHEYMYAAFQLQIKSLILLAVSVWNAASQKFSGGSVERKPATTV